MDTNRPKLYFAGRFFILLFSFFILLFTPQLWLRIKYRSLIYSQVEHVPRRTFAVVFGAWVGEDHSLSDVTKERVEAGIQLYASQKVEKLFISGDDRSNQQAEEMANYAIQSGVNPADIVIDKFGIDTNDTCKHFAQVSSEGILITQGYHLPRTMLMCKASKIDVIGLSADQLGILSSRGDNIFQIYVIRTWRIFREAALTWLYITGIYDRLSIEAESLQQSELREQTKLT